ncbi:PREDICTED: putative nuclease HARBI1 [Rhagoletis zephyria]|uniref:putative nuclease HARBI1 n=1 Tax=Rhagoletis zephyria TaxID=28612 RepID=UPI00081138CF|nr:PREDICTED: putative nuclease HARBI1 [Rhagoletis zephyria]
MSVQHPKESWLIGDQGYPLESWLLTPVGAPNTSKEQKYNRLHGSARNCIERAFGVLKSRFRCLLKHRVLHYSHETSALVVSTCVILHNIMTKAGIMLNEVEDEVAEDFDSPNNAVDSSQYIREGERTRSRYISTL